MTTTPIAIDKRRGSSFSSPLTTTVSDAATTTVTDVITGTHRTSGTAAAGYGTGVLLRVEDDAGNVDNAARLACVLTDATSASEDTDFIVELRDAGAALAEKFRVTSDGELKFGGAVLDVSTSAIRLGTGTDRAPQFPQLTTAQRDALTGTEGMVVRNTTTGQLEEYDGGAWKALGSGGAVTGTNSLSFAVNQDATAGSDEDPYVVLSGGDGVEIVSTVFRQDSSADRAYLFLQLDSLADGRTDRTTDFTIGPHTEVSATTDDVDATIRWRGHFATDAVTTFKESTSRLDVSASDWIFTAPAAFAISFASNVDAEAGLDVTGGAFTAAGGTATINSTGATTLDASTTLTLCGTAGTPTIGRAGVTTTNAGALTVSQATTCNGSFAQSGGTASVNSTGATTLNASTTLTVCGTAGAPTIGRAGVTTTNAGALTVSQATTCNGSFAQSGGTASINSTGATTVDASTTLTLCGTAGTPTIGRAGVTTTNAGSLTVSQTTTCNGALAQSGGTATINSTGATTLDASTTLTVCGTAGTPTIGRAGVTTTNAGALSVTESVGAGGAPAASAILTATSTSKGFLPPRMTAAQRDAIGSPVAGLVAFNTDTNRLNWYDGAAWLSEGKSKERTADLSITNDAALTVDPAFTVTLPVGSHILRYVLRVTSNTTADFQCQHAAAGGLIASRGRATMMAIDTSSEGWSSTADVALPFTSVLPILSASHHELLIEVCLTVTTAGDLEFSWAQNTSDAGATLVGQNSYVEQRMIAA